MTILFAPSESKRSGGTLPPIDKDAFCFSNLFGPICAKDRVPEYKLKQAEKIGKFAPEKFYKKHFSKGLDLYLEKNAPIIDLRAGFMKNFTR